MDCSPKGQVVIDFIYDSPNVYSYGCADESSPDEDCKNKIIKQCTNNWGMKSFVYNDDGQGNTTCTGVCSDDSIAEDKPDCDVYPFCDVADDNSDLDFGGGSTGSSVDPSTTTTQDTEHDVDYDPDASALDPTAPFSSIQGDKLINEVIADKMKKEYVIDKALGQKFIALNKSPLGTKHAR